MQFLKDTRSYTWVRHVLNGREPMVLIGESPPAPAALQHVRLANGGERRVHRSGMR